VWSGGGREEERKKREAGLYVVMKRYPKRFSNYGDDCDDAEY
jgi:hypothetical protein